MKKKTSKGNILSRAKPVGVGGGLTCLFYGRSGTGKTTLAGSFPGPVLFLDIDEKGTGSVSDVEDATVLSVESWDELDEIYWALKEQQEYKTVVIDALPGLQQLAITEARRISKKGEGVPTSQRDMGEATKLMHTLIYNYRDLKDLGMNVVMNAHDRVREVDSDDDVAIAPEVGPNLMPGISKAIMGAVDVVGLTFIRIKKSEKKIGQKTTVQSEYCLRIGPHEIYNTKVRTPKNIEVPEFISDPSYDKLVSVIKGKTSTTRTNSKLRKRK